MAEIHPYSPGLKKTKKIFPCTGISPCRTKKKRTISATEAHPAPSEAGRKTVLFHLQPPVWNENQIPWVKSTSPPSLFLPATCHLAREFPLCLLATLVHPWCSAGLLGVSQVLTGPVRGQRHDFRAWRQRHP